MAHEIIRTIFYLFTRRQAYRDPGFDYQAALVKKNAPRWIKALKNSVTGPSRTSTLSRVGPDSLSEPNALIHGPISERRSRVRLIGGFHGNDL